jgi:hypothetical protein
MRNDQKRAVDLEAQSGELDKLLLAVKSRPESPEKDLAITPIVTACAKGGDGTGVMKRLAEAGKDIRRGQRYRCETGCGALIAKALRPQARLSEPLSPHVIESAL